MANIYYTGDYAVRDPEVTSGFLGRADEVLKVAGHRIGTVELESALVSHPAVSEAAVMGKEDAVKGEVPVAFVVLTQWFPAKRRVASRTCEAYPRYHRSNRNARCSRHREQAAKDAKRQNHAKHLKAVLVGAPIGDVSTLEDDASVEDIKEHLRRNAQATRQEIDDLPLSFSLL